MAQGHKLLKEEKGEASLHGVFYLATAYELYRNLNIQDYKFDRQALDQFLDSVEERLKDGLNLLHHFALQGNRSIFIYLFAERPNIKSHLDTLTGILIKETPLHMAIKSGSAAIARFLLEQGADIKKGRYGKYARTVLHIAVENGQEEIVDLLLAHKDIQDILNVPQGDNGYTALHLAAAKGYFSILLKLINYGSDTEKQDVLSRTPLEILLEHESLDFERQDECACLLLSKKSPAFFQLDNSSLKRCFTNALEQGLLQAAQKLAVNGLPQLREQEPSFLEIAAEGVFQRTRTLSPQPIEIPQEKRVAYISIIRWLLKEKKIDPDQKFTQRTDFLIHQVCYAGCSELLSLLIDLEVDMKKLDHYQNNALHRACCSPTDCVDTVCILLGYDPTLMEAKNNEGRTPLHLAALTGNVKIVECLLDQITDQNKLDQSDREGNTALHLAVMGEGIFSNKKKDPYCKTVEALVKKGASLGILNQEKKMAIELAYKNGNETIIKALLQAT
nr:ankyrin repeat domain-containing protein [Parachlamydia sp. AcF125]